MVKFFTIPGYGNSGEDHWQSNFELELDNISRINQESWDHPICEDWVNEINKAVGGKDISETIIITHSLGGIALAHWANQYNKKIKGALIVAPPDLENPYEELNLGSFTPLPLKELPFPSILVCSSSDNWATLERSRLFAVSWGSRLIVLNNAGHINPDSGYNKWEHGLEILEELI